MNHYVVTMTMHLQNSDISQRKKYASRIEIDCWKFQILLGVVRLYVHNNAHIQVTVLGGVDSKQYILIDAKLLLKIQSIEISYGSPAKEFFNRVK
jgi:hypothetical protein